MTAAAPSLGFDVGGQSIKAVLASPDGEVLAHASAATGEEMDPGAFVGALESLRASLLRDAGAASAGSVGIGIAGVLAGAVVLAGVLGAPLLLPKPVARIVVSDATALTASDGAGQVTMGGATRIVADLGGGAVAAGGDTALGNLADSLQLATAMAGGRPARLLVEGGDVDGLERRVSALLTDPAAFEALREQGMALSRGRTWQCVASLQADLYARVAEGKRNTVPFERSPRARRAHAAREFGPPAPTIAGMRPFALPVLREGGSAAEVLAKAIDVGSELKARVTTVMIR